jgi:capsular polysaccharide biosynthesis protein
LKLLLEGGGAGLGAGLLLSLLCLIGLTLMDTSIRSAQDVEPSIGYRVVGVVPKIA